MSETFWQKSSEIVGPKTVQEFDQIGQQDTRDALESFIIEQSDEDTSLLDAGCNTGVLAYRLTEKQFPGVYHGIDSNNKALVHALQNVAGRRTFFSQSDLSDIRFSDSSFDIVVSKDVVEHAEGYQPIIKELARLTKNYFVLSMFIKMHDQADHIEQDPRGFYMNRYNRQKLYDYTKGLGLQGPEIVYAKDEDEVLVFKKSGGMLKTFFS